MSLQHQFRRIVKCALPYGVVKLLQHSNSIIDNKSPMCSGSPRDSILIDPRYFVYALHGTGDASFKYYFESLLTAPWSLFDQYSVETISAMPPGNGLFIERNLSETNIMSLKDSILPREGRCFFWLVRDPLEWQRSLLNHGALAYFFHLMVREQYNLDEIKETKDFLRQFLRTNLDAFSSSSKTKRFLVVDAVLQNPDQFGTIKIIDHKDLIGDRCLHTMKDIGSMLSIGFPEEKKAYLQAYGSYTNRYVLYINKIEINDYNHRKGVEPESFWLSFCPEEIFDFYRSRVNGYANPFEVMTVNGKKYVLYVVVREDSTSNYPLTVSEGGRQRLEFAITQFQRFIDLAAVGFKEHALTDDEVIDEIKKHPNGKVFTELFVNDARLIRELAPDTYNSWTSFLKLVN